MNQNSRIVIITGANSGIGKAAAHLFAKDGHTVIMACRNMKRSEPVRREVEKASGNERVDLMQLDMSSFESIRKFCSSFQGKYGHLDNLIHNAAYFNHGSAHRLSPDDIELTFATNVFGPYLMTMLLLGQLKKSMDARIVHASSNIVKHFFNPKREIDWSRIIGPLRNAKRFSVYDMYCESKMALVLLTLKMSKEFAEHSISVNALQINGAKMSKETLQKVTGGWRMIARVQNLYFPPAEKMAAIYHEMCLSDKFSGITGKVVNDKREIMSAGIAKPGPLQQMKQLFGTAYYPHYADRVENQERIWQLCNEICEI